MTKWTGRKADYTPEEWEEKKLYQRRWMKAEYIYARDLFGNRCQVCGRENNRLEFHHLSYRNGYRNGKAPSIRPWKEVRENPENFRLLCRMCHEAVTRLADPNTAPKILEIVKLTSGASSV